MSANSCRNLVHFRGSLISGLQDAGYRLIAIAPNDASAPALIDGMWNYDHPFGSIDHQSVRRTSGCSLLIFKPL